MPDLPANLPENWTSNQIISPNGTEVGLTEQHGYNYLMKMVNACQRLLNAISGVYIAGGTGSALTIDDLTPEDNQRIQVLLTNSIEDGATLNGLPILSEDGLPILANAVQGAYLILCYNASAAAWYKIGGDGFYIRISESNDRAYLEYDPETQIVYVVKAGTPSGDVTLAQHEVTALSHINMRVDGNSTVNVDTSTTLAEHMANELAHQNLIIDGNNN